MSDNYHDTVYRMYESSDILYKQKQWFNSNKRYGADSSILNKDNLALDIHAEIEELMDMVIKMEIDGVLI